MASWSGTLTIVGNLIADPELRFTQGGKAVASCTVAVSKKDQNKKESTYFVDVVSFEKMAENLCASCKKGDRVVVFGDPDPQEWQKEGEPIRRKLGIVAIEIAPSLKYAFVEIHKPAREQAAPAPAPTADDPDLKPF